MEKSMLELLNERSILKRLLSITQSLVDTSAGTLLLLNGIQTKSIFGEDKFRGDLKETISGIHENINFNKDEIILLKDRIKELNESLEVFPKDMIDKAKHYWEQHLCEVNLCATKQAKGL